jgi:hypothetical protein
MHDKPREQIVHGSTERLRYLRARDICIKARGEMVDGIDPEGGKTFGAKSHVNLPSSWIQRREIDAVHVAL